MKKLIKCVVSATDANGSPSWFAVTVEATDDQIENGKHYQAAKDEAADYGYEPYLVYDESDATPSFFNLFDWDKSAIQIS